MDKKISLEDNTEIGKLLPIEDFDNLPYGMAIEHRFLKLLIVLDEGTYNLKDLPLYPQFDIDTIEKYLFDIYSVKGYKKEISFYSNSEKNIRLLRLIKKYSPIFTITGLEPKLWIKKNQFANNFTTPQKTLIYINILPSRFFDKDLFVKIPDRFKDNDFLSKLGSWYEMNSNGAIKELPQGIQESRRVFSVLSDVFAEKINLEHAMYQISNGLHGNLDLSLSDKKIFTIGRLSDLEYYDEELLSMNMDEFEKYRRIVIIRDCIINFFYNIQEKIDKSTFEIVSNNNSKSFFSDNTSFEFDNEFRNPVLIFIDTLYNLSLDKRIDVLENKNINSLNSKKILPFENPFFKEFFEFAYIRFVSEYKFSLNEIKQLYDELELSIRSFINNCDNPDTGKFECWTNKAVLIEYWKSIIHYELVVKLWKSLLFSLNYFLKSKNINQEKNVFYTNINWRIEHDIDKEREYKNWRDFSFDRLYSTHAWIAHIPILIINKLPKLYEKWNYLVGDQFWTEDRIKLYLYATAAPDYPDIIKLEGLLNNFLIGNFHLLRFAIYHNKICRKKSLDYIYKLDNRFARTKSVNFKDCVDLCNILGMQTLDHLKNRQFDYAVFRLGNLAHFISDCACFPHLFDYMNDTVFLKKVECELKRLGKLEKDTVLNNNNIKHNHYSVIDNEFNAKIHLNYQWMISERTDGKQGGNYSHQSALDNKWNEQFLFDFFHINFAYIQDNIKPISPEKAALNTAEFTFLGTNNNIYDSTPYICNNYFDIMPKDWKEIPINWQSFNPLSEKDRLRKIFLLKFQNNLQEAILNICNCFVYIIENIKV